MAGRVRSCLLAWALSSTLTTASEPVPIDADDECSGGDEDGATCALSALQLRAKGAATVQVAAEAGCHDAVEGEACHGEVMWAKNDGMVNHPDWYSKSGLTSTSSDAEIQNWIHQTHVNMCPRPCSIAYTAPQPWCLKGAAVAPTLWAPTEGKDPMHVKILTYNLFWWNLFKINGGRDNSAAKLIQEFNAPMAFDVMGFQECEDINRVLDPVGLSDDFEGFQGPHAICMAYNKKAWTLLAKGTQDVSEDMQTRYYGRRGTQWMRLQHTETGRTLFFVNHHGPLSVNSGGVCGGQATAYNILAIMAKHAAVGDILSLVGDFNANAASLTIQTLWSNLVQSFAGESFGGVDNIFTNAASADVVETKVMGDGGSDHKAIYAVLQLGAPAGRGPMLKSMETAPVKAAKELTGKAKPGHGWGEFWCGQIEDQTEYSFALGGWNKSVVFPADAAADPEHCCRECQAIGSDCQSWSWQQYSAQGGKLCLMNGDLSPTKKPMDGVVSGLAYTASAKHALQSAMVAKRHM